MSSARVGLDARLTRQLSAGMKAYTRELVARLPKVAPEYAYVAFTDGGNFGWDEQVRLPVAMHRANLDVVHFLAQYVPIFLPQRFVMTIHDLIHLRFPQYFKAKVGPYYATVVRFACARARRVITDDERTVDDLQEFLGVDRSKVRVIPLGVAEIFAGATAPYAPPRPYILNVGNHRRHKDLATLFEAWSRLPDGLHVDLYVTGADDFAGELERRSTPARAIVALGEVTTERLAAYYAGARALVQPSLREGFGLPMLEAMAAGCPVVACSDAVPAPLAASALTFRAHDAGALQALMERLLGDEGLRMRAINLGREAARTLSWDRCARATADVYAEVLEEA
ncbi:MAG: glycosyltransferase family 4 protein [Candidatus Eremiobacteraeota bacterium]|nr:glycosyltransferase family 4 protein [Candidatus Eremiobacteraeota bacterium]